MAVTRVAATVIELQLALAVLFDGQFARADDVVSKEVFHREESHFRVAARLVVRRADQALLEVRAAAPRRILLRAAASVGATRPVGIVGREPSLNQLVVVNVEIVGVGRAEGDLSHAHVARARTSID